MVTEKNLVEGYKWIVIADGYMSGNPAILGKRFSVDLILVFISQGLSVKEIVEDYELPEEAVLEALRFARESVAKRKT